MASLPVHQFRGPAGVDLAWREAGDGGHPVVLLHPLFGNGATLAGTPLAQALLVGLFPDARVVQVPGDHETVLAAPGFGAALLDFLGY